jgi:transposase
VAVVNPARVRQFARACGLLAKTDKLDAQVLAVFGQRVQPRHYEGQKRSRKTTECSVGAAQTGGGNAESRAKSPAHHFCEPHEFCGTSPSLPAGAGEVRSVLYMATLVATPRSPVIRTQYQHLLKRGKEKKVALTACMRKFLTILNAMQRDQQPFRM